MERGKQLDRLLVYVMGLWENKGECGPARTNNAHINTFFAHTDKRNLTVSSKEGWQRFVIVRLFSLAVDARKFQFVRAALLKRQISSSQNTEQPVS